MESFDVFKERYNKAANARDLAKAQLKVAFANGDRVKASHLASKVDTLSTQMRVAMANMDIIRKRR